MLEKLDELRLALERRIFGAGSDDGRPWSVCGPHSWSTYRLDGDRPTVASTGAV